MSEYNHFLICRCPRSPYPEVASPGRRSLSRSPPAPSPFTELGKLWHLPPPWHFLPTLPANPPPPFPTLATITPSSRHLCRRLYPSFVIQGVVVKNVTVSVVGLASIAPSPPPLMSLQTHPVATAAAAATTAGGYLEAANVPTAAATSSHPLRWRRRGGSGERLVAGMVTEGVGSSWLHQWASMGRAPEPRPPPLAPLSPLSRPTRGSPVTVVAGAGRNRALRS